MADTESETTTTTTAATTAAPIATAFPPQTGLVRRLHVIETCRLMGFPDDYLDVDGEETKDAPRYKACGNSWAVNCAEFVNARIERALREKGAVADGEAVRYATTCSGVEAHSLSVRGADWSPQFFSEIEKFPCRVLAHRYPSVPNLGDMTAVDGTKWSVDVFSGGSPCQSISVAGKRHGMAEGSGTRSSLAFHWLRIANEANARVALWENVPGAFSTNGGRDFAWLVHRLCESGWGVAWRTLDAQFCFSWTFPRAIPQRRRRIWLVAVRGGDWKTAAKILFERTSAASAVAPLRVLGDGTVVREETRRGGGTPSPADDAADTPFSRQSRADWLPDGFFGDGDALTDEQSRSALGRLGEVRYCGRMFGGDADLFSGADGNADAEAEQTPENIRDDFLKALGAGSGVAVGTSAVALKTAMWPSGIQPPWRVLAEKGEGFEPPQGFDGTVCGLSDILLPWSEKVSHLILSERACAGIVRRASQRGKELKKVLSDALAGQIASWQSGALDGVAKKKGTAR